MEHINENEATASEMKALLAELQDIDGGMEAITMDPPNRSLNNGPKLTTDQPHSRRTHRLVTKIPKPMSGQLLARDEGNSSAPTAAERRRNSTTSGGKTPGFSTYSISPSSCSGLSEQSKRHTPTPLGIRLAPIDSLGDNSKSDSPSKQKVSRYSLKPFTATLPGTPNVLPPLSTDDAIATSPVIAQTPPPDSEKGSLRLNKNQQNATERDRLPQKADCSVSANGNPNNTTRSGDYNFEVNFLPIMCALHLTQGGLKPQPRWGHTLTPVGDEHLFMFGGMEATSAESNSLMVFDTISNEWRPAYVLPKDGVSKMRSSPPPTTRYNHAACAYEGSCLIIYGGVAVHGHLVYNDIHMYNSLTCTWKCLWHGPPSDTAKSQSDTSSVGSKKHKKNEPVARFGHSMVVRDDRLYIFGGKVVGQEGMMTTKSTDVYVFSVSSRSWKKRIRLNGMATDDYPDTKSPKKLNTTVSGIIDIDKQASETGSPEDLMVIRKPQSDVCALCARAYHASTVKGDIMYINGGTGEDGNILNDTWQLNLKTGVWTCLHNGDTGGAIPRERHAMFACGEAIMVIGGCSSTPQSASVMTKFAHFVSVLPLLGQATPCWIPVAMGNASIIAPNKKNFAAAFCGGFVYVFGGTGGSESISNSMVYFLATDGYASEDGKDAVVDSDESLRLMMQSLQDKGSLTVPYDVLVVADIAGGDTGEGKGKDGVGIGGESLRGASASPDSRYQVGLHRVILQQRAPKFLESLLACRSEFVVSNPEKGRLDHRRESQTQKLRDGDLMDTDQAMGIDASSDGGDAVDALLLGKDIHIKGSLHSTSASGCSTAAVSNDLMIGGTASVSPNAMVYYVQGNKRVKGLPHPLTAEELRCLANYIYWGGLKAKFRLLLKDDDDDEGVQMKGGVSAEVSERQRLRSVLMSLRTAADDYDLKPLHDLTEALLEGDRHRLSKARQSGMLTLRNDMIQLLDTAKGATVTVLFVDPHTKQRKAHALHPVVLASSSTFFEQLLRPLFKEGKTNVSVDGVVAKLSCPEFSILRKRLPQGEQGLHTGPMDATSSSKAPPLTGSRTSIVVGPVSVPFPAIQILLRYLYTKQLQVPQQLALQTMMGAHRLGLSLLKAHCEAIVGRSDVNYESCCSFYFLSKRYKASLLREMALLTIVSGYSKVRSEAAFRDLPDEDRKIIDTVSMELGSDTWVPPQQPAQEIKPLSEYASRWNAISHW
ncbi:unnamed protein product [Phytomonas sp. EM1]|nr:unnamed protein product [Phytomonas sp. EM1]|eukprot:CCW61957.1 unnamed protein product [Phytomonas sp. isolate EM1]